MCVVGRHFNHYVTGARLDSITAQELLIDKITSAWFFHLERSDGKGKNARPRLRTLLIPFGSPDLRKLFFFFSLSSSSFFFSFFLFLFFFFFEALVLAKGGNETFRRMINVKLTVVVLHANLLMTKPVHTLQAFANGHAGIIPHGVSWHD